MISFVLTWWTIYGLRVLFQWLIHRGPVLSIQFFLCVDGTFVYDRFSHFIGRELNSREPVCSSTLKRCTYSTDWGGTPQWLQQHKSSGKVDIGRHDGLSIVRLTSDRAVLIRALAGDIVLFSWARHFTLIVLLHSGEKSVTTLGMD